MHVVKISGVLRGLEFQKQLAKGLQAQHESKLRVTYNFEAENFSKKILFCLVMHDYVVQNIIYFAS